MNWTPTLFILGYHVLLLILLPAYLILHSTSWGLWVAAILLFFASGLSITAGYHRLYSHRAYKARTPVELLLLWFGTLAVQGSVIRWCFDHRLHHAHSDGDHDPYSVKKGFWHAHMLWIFTIPKPIDPKVVSDLLARPLLRWQDKHYQLLMLAVNIMTCIFVGWLVNDYVGAFIVAGLLRLFATHHSTWFINSLAHSWGWKPFCQEQSAVDNFVLSLVTFGEGYHNFHHTFANDYRNGIRWYHFDPTKWLIWSLSKIGLTSSLRRTDWLTIRKRMVLERKNLLMQRLGNAWTQGGKELETLVHELSDRLVTELTALNEVRKQLADYDYRNAPAELHHKLQELQQTIRNDWKAWTDLSRLILRHAT